MKSSKSICAFVIVLCLCPGKSLPYPYRPNDFEAEHEMVVAEIGSKFESSDFDKVYDASNYFGSGEAANEGYKKYDEFLKGVQGKYEKDGERKHYNQEGGKKTGHVDQSTYYKDNNGAVKSSVGADFAVSNSFRKGSKTSGFHDVHHKEEYKKNQQFYDEKHQGGHLKKYGDFGAASVSVAGQTQNGAKLDAAYNNANYGKAGNSERGKFDENLKKINAANGYDNFYSNYANYAKAHQQN